MLKLMVFGRIMMFTRLLIVLLYLARRVMWFVIALGGFRSIMVMRVLIFILTIRLRSMRLKVLVLFAVVRLSRLIGWLILLELFTSVMSGERGRWSTRLPSYCYWPSMAELAREKNMPGWGCCDGVRGRYVAAAWWCLAELWAIYCR